MKVDDKHVDNENQESPEHPPGPKQKVMYRVVIDGLSSRVETVEAFSIKFSLLAKLPLRKVKHVMKSFPATLWTGKQRGKAEKLLYLVEEVGGDGRVIEVSEEDVYGSRAHGGKGGSRRAEECPHCGFPISSSEEYCGFCMTLLRERSTTAPESYDLEESPDSNPPWFYIAIGIAALIMIVIVIASIV